jgi:hypothetical protein
MPQHSRLGVSLAFVIAAIWLGLLLLPSGVSAAAVTRYVDCVGGNDAYTGTATTAAWRTLSKANTASLLPGDKLLLKRGCTWTGPLNAKWVGTALAPITIGAYGTGELPKIQNARDNVVVTGSRLVLENLHARADPPAYDSGCQNQPMGWRVGFRFMSGAAYNIIRNSKATELYFGIMLGSGSHHNAVLNNLLRDNNLKDTDPAVGSGSIGILVAGDDNEIASNQISGSDACSYFYGGRDGAAVEIYGGQRNRIHHNIALQNNSFTELGNSRSSDNVYAYNYVRSSLIRASFLTTRGASDTWGPVARTTVLNTTVYLTGSQSYAIQCTGGCGPSILTLKNNVVWSEDRVGYADAGFDEGYNIYWRSDGLPKVWFPISSTSRKVDPRFVNRGALDLRLASTSPAIDKGSTAAFNLGYKSDLDAVPVPQGAAVDIGTYEYKVLSTPTPSATPTATPLAPTATPTPTATATQTPKPTTTPLVTPTPTASAMAPADVTGTATIGGPAVAITTTVPGQNGSITFAGTTGQRISIALTGVTIAQSDVSVLKPDQSLLVEPVFVTSQGSFIDTRTLPSSGTYRIRIDPRGTYTGTMTVQVYAVPPDATASIAIGGPAVSIASTVPGQNASLTFTGTAGQAISLALTNVTVGQSDVSIVKPDASTFIGPIFVTSGGAFVDRTTMPASGTYRILVNPRGAYTGAVTAQLYAVPPDVTGSLTAGGPAVTVTTTVPGQNASLSFSGTAGQTVSFALTNVTIGQSDVSVLKPDGTIFLGPMFVTTLGTSLSNRVLPVSGTYRIVVNPRSAYTGSMTLRVS